MNIVRKPSPWLLLVALLFAVTGCETTTGNQSTTTKVSQPTNEKWVYNKDEAYFAQHRLLRTMALKDAEFVEKLKADQSLAIFSAAKSKSIYDWDGVAVEVVAGDGDKIPAIIYLTFPKPKDMPLCYHVAIVDLGDTARYITLEKTLALGSNAKASLCEWYAGNAGHGNYGPVSYSDLSSFKADVIKLIRDGATIQARINAEGTN